MGPMTGLNTTTETRLKKEARMASKNKGSQIVLDPCVDGNLFHWRAWIIPDKSSIYHNITFELDVKIPATYPYKPPRIIFESPIFHPNINSGGLICISSLGKDWSPALTIEKSLYSILSLLDEPNPMDPLRPEAAELFLTNKEEYEARCRTEGDKGN